MRRALSLFITAPLLFGIACDLGEPVDQDAGKNGADASAAMDASGSKDSGSGAADAGQNGADASAALDASGSKDSGSGALDAGQHGADASGVADASQTKDSGADARDAGNDAGRDAGARDGALPEYFQPTPVVCPVNSNTWGDKAVLPRDTCNGLEDRTATPTVRPKWMYWDGKVLRGPDGRYHMFSSRWPQSNGMNGWGNSEVIHAVSQSLLGPYEDKGYAYDDGPDAQSRHKGHNVTACELPDGTYCLVVSEIVPFTIFTSNSLDGPWKNRGRVQIDTNGVPLNIPPPGDQHLESNVSLVVRPDGNFQIVQRHGIIALSTTGLLGPYKVQRPTTNYPASQAPPADLASIFPNRPKHLDPLVSQAPESTYVWAEDPVIWYSGGQYHVIYNYPLTRVAYHLTSPDGIHGWTDRGLAYDPRNSKQFFSNTDGTVDHWFNMERPGVFMEGGHVTHFSFAVSDADKGGLAGGSNNDTKVVVVAFDGTTFDRDTCQ